MNVVPSHSRGIQFGVTSLLLLTVLSALAVSAVLHFGIAGTILLVGVGAVASVGLLRFAAHHTRRFWLDAIWGIALPLACLFTDPLVFTDGLDVVSTQPSRFAVACYLFIGWQMTHFVLSWFLTADQPRLNCFVSGTLLGGALFATVIAVCLAPFTLMLMLFIIGIPGITPALTAIVYFRSAWRCWSVGRLALKQNAATCWLVTGSVLSASVGAVTYLCLPEAFG